MNDIHEAIRAYRTDDLEAVMAVWKRANAVAHPFLSESFVAQSEQEIRDIYMPMTETFVLEEDGAIIGFIALLGNQIGGLFLDPSKHGKGLGRAMVDHAVALKGPLRVEVFRNNAIGRPFYERYGFEFVEDEMHEPSGQMNRKLAMPGA
ncbi:GNAT family N-acetyltransferase [Tropicimonas sp. TH_r6]|uniref:GNAT family N-acetyltransferase n=1 Tax=Tropicimonas sp. TH_r6 TaxID=3082085 RepID=UPI002952AD66|nr:GNAT family N-acetyltransferase [Tropicimonas sp. TH_r6]MDV7143068.1 GNAT family N-acetyltransferase [Tropicimonas sp. TH_r6]